MRVCKKCRVTKPLKSGLALALLKKRRQKKLYIVLVMILAAVLIVVQWLVVLVPRIEQLRGIP